MKADPNDSDADLNSSRSKFKKRKLLSENILNNIIIYALGSAHEKFGV